MTELARLFLSGILGPIVGVVVAALAGQRIAVHWSLRQKQREMALATANEFYRLYGEFFSIWKLWDHTLEDADRGTVPEDRRYKLLERAALAEGGIETMLVRLAAIRVLNDEQQNIAARFRQGYQSLRESLHNKVPIPWFHSEHAEYVAFKQLACSMAQIIATSDGTATPTSIDAGKALLNITSNRWEEQWSNEKPSK